MLDTKIEASEEDFQFSLLGINLKQLYLNILASADWMGSDRSVNSPAALPNWLYLLGVHIQRSNILNLLAVILYLL